MKHYEIRKGEEKDIPALMKLIRELAEFERAPEKVLNSETKLLEDWKTHHAFDFLVVELEGKVVGISLYYPRYSTWNGRCYYLEDLYIQPKYRGNGIGKALLLATIEEAREAGARRLDWQVLDWNEGAVRFYKSLGAVIEKEWWNCKLEI